MKSRRKFAKGFTLIEMIIFVALFSVVMASFTLIFINVAGVESRQGNQVEVQSQSQFLLQTVQYYIERSSLVDIPAGVATSTLKLRMSSSTEDPTIISLVNGAVTLQAGAAAPQVITSNRVSVSSLSFTARSNPGAHTSVAVAFMIDYATSNFTQRFSTALQTSVARVAAATFDSNIVPSTGNTYQLGASAGDWRSINNTMFFSGSSVGIGVNPAASTPLEVTGGDIYVADSGSGVLLKNGSNCYRLTVTSSGVPTTTAVSPCP